MSLPKDEEENLETNLMLWLKRMAKTEADGQHL